MPIRVLLSELPPLLQEILAGAVSAAPDMVLVGACDDAAQANAALADSRVDVLIVPTSASEAPACVATEVSPSVRILEIGEELFDVFELRLLARDPSVGAVLGSIRDVARRAN